MKDEKKAFQAYSPHGTCVAATPKEAAKRHFTLYPSARKCNVTEGYDDGFFFTVVYGRKSDGEWPGRWKDVTKKTIETLPGG